MNTTLFYKINILLFFTLFSILGFSQEGGVEIKITVKYNKKPVPNAKIEVFEGGSNIKTLSTNTIGKQTVRLEFDKDYILKISKKDLVSKKISINTVVTKDKDIIYPYKFTIELFDMVEGLDVSPLEKPVTKIKFFENIGDFDFDPEYTESMRAQIEKMLRDLEILTKKKYTSLIAKADKLFREKRYKEAYDVYDESIVYCPEYDYYPEDQMDKCERLMAEEKSNNNEYNRLITSADNYFSSKNYTVAKTTYVKASKIKPGEQYPKDKIAEIDKLLAEQKAAAEKDKSYKDAIAKADGLFNQKDYQGAKTSYNAALSIKPGEQYPKDKIAEIDKLLAEQKAAAEKDKSYKDVIANADKYFANKKYEESKREYEKASKIKPEEQYPKDKISEIEGILAELAQKAEADKAAARTKYKDAVQKADYFFNKKDYTSAESYYRKALTFIPEEQYPKDKIKEIIKIKEELKAQLEANKAKDEPEEIKFENEEEKKKFLSELAKKYPEGITIENYTPKGKTIKRIIVVRGGIANDYREVKHDWGGKYYFKNGQSISSNIFYSETQE